VKVEVDDGCIQQTDRSSYYIWQYFTVSNSSEAKKGGAKIAICKFCDKTFSDIFMKMALLSIQLVPQVLL
jgi:hypothetical protein